MNADWSGPERRREERRSKSAPLVLLEKKREPVNEGLVLRDVSAGGLAFETNLDLQKGDSIRFAVHIPQAGWVEGDGTICWCRPVGPNTLCGAEIELMGWSDMKRLGRWLSPRMGLVKYFFQPPQPDDSPSVQ